MRWLGCLITGLVLAAASNAEDEKPPYRGALRKAADEEGTVSITVPKGWTDKEKPDGTLIHVYATAGGGHDIAVTREAGPPGVALAPR